MCPGAVTILFLYGPTGYTSSIMMRFLTQNKTSIIAAVVLAIVLYGYFAFFRPGFSVANELRGADSCGAGRPPEPLCSCWEPITRYGPAEAFERQRRR